MSADLPISNSELSEITLMLNIMKPSNKTIFEYFSEFADQRPDDVFIFNENISLTACQTLGITVSLANQMYKFGVTEGTEVFVCSTRTINTILCIFALQFIGANVVLIDPREYSIREGYCLNDEYIFYGLNSLKLNFNAGIAEFKHVSNSKIPTLTIFTSGSTGKPKTVRLSQYNFINNSLDTKNIGGYFADDINMDIVPIHHVFGLALIFTAVVTRHAVFVPSCLDVDYILSCIIKYGVTRLNGVPSLYLAMAQNPLSKEVVSLRCGLIGGAVCTPEQFRFIEGKLGLTLIPVYGMSECIGISCGNLTDSIEERCGSVGKVYSMNKIKFLDDGEILIKSPAMAYGEGDPDGWLHSGDLGFIDAKGFLHVNGRKKDIIIRNGNNLSAIEIERKILGVKGVRDVCVVGISDEREGEVPVAAIVADTMMEEKVLREISSVLVKNHIPKEIKFVDAVPLTSSGKPDKQAVRKMYESK